MWAGQTTEEIFCEMCAMSCQDHTLEVSKIPDLTKISRKNSKTFWVIKTHIMGPFFFSKPYFNIPEKWLIRSQILPENRVVLGVDLDRPKELRDKLFIIDSVSTYLVALLLKVCCICNEIPTEGDLNDYYNMKFYTQFNGHTAELEVLQFGNSLRYVTGLPFFEITRDNFPGCDLKLLSFSILISYYYFLVLYPRINEECKKFKHPHDVSWTKEYLKFVIPGEDGSYKANEYSSIVYFSRAEEWLKLCMFINAELDCRALLVLNPFWCKAYFMLAECLRSQHQFHTAHIVMDFGVRVSLCIDRRDLVDFNLYIEDLKLRCSRCQKYRSHHINSSASLKLSRPDFDCASDIPELIYSSSSESDDEKKPKSDDKDYYVDEDEFSCSDQDLPMLESTSACSSQRETLDDEEEEIEEDEYLYDDDIPPGPDEIEPQVNERKTFMGLKERGYRALIELRCPSDAKMEFADALNLIKDGAIPDITSSEIASLKYAYAYACRQCSTQEDIVRSMSIFRELIEQNVEFKFPTAYYQLALAYYDLNNFKEALNTLSTLQRDFDSYYDVLCWPMLDIKYGMSSETLKGQIEDLRNSCENPPPPDAKCRYQFCSLERAIYYTDLEFKGFMAIECHEHCLVQYHISCWKAFKDEFKKSDKEFVDFHCMTPDCEGFIIVVSTIGKSGNVEKRFESEERKLKKTVKQKKSKLEKKMQIKEFKKRQRCRTVSHSDTNEQHEEGLEVTMTTTTTTMITTTTTMTVKAATNDIVPSSTHTTISASTTEHPAKSIPNEPTALAKPFYMIKKDTDNKVTEQKLPKIKERKKPKKSTVSIDEFRGNFVEHDVSNLNDYQRRVYRLQESKRVVEGQGIEYRTKWQCETLLQERKTLDINDPELKQELVTSSPELKKLIDESGGLETLMLENDNFAVVRGKLCLFSEMMNLYNSAQIAELGSFSQLDEASENNMLTDQNNGQSKLNPHAAEYSPNGSSSSLMLPSSSHEDCDVSETSIRSVSISFDTNVDCNEELEDSFLNAFSKLRSPLSQLSILPKANDVPSEPEEMQVLPASSESFDAKEFSKELHHFWNLTQKSKVPTKNIASCFYDVVKLARNADSVDDITKCFSELGRHRNSVDKDVQATSQVKSKGVMKTDKELLNMKKESEKLTSKNKDLVEKQKLLESRLEESLDSIARLQNKLNTEIPVLEKSLAEVEAEKKDECKSLKVKIATLEKDLREYKMKHQSLVDSKKECRQQITMLQKEVCRFNIQVRDLNKKCEAYEDNIPTKSKVEGFVKINDALVEQKTKEAEQALVRAREAELNFLTLKKTMYLQKLDGVIAEANRNIQVLQRDLDNATGELQPFLATSLKMMLSQIKQHAQEMYKVRMETQAKGDQLIAKLKGGSNLKDLEDFTYPTLPPLPNMADIKKLTLPSASQAATMPPPLENDSLTEYMSTVQPSVFDPFSTPTTPTSPNEQVNEFFRLQTPFQAASSAGSSGNVEVPGNGALQFGPAEPMPKGGVSKTPLPPGLPVSNEHPPAHQEKGPNVSSKATRKSCLRKSPASSRNDLDDNGSTSSFRSCASTHTPSLFNSNNRDVKPSTPILQVDEKSVIPPEAVVQSETASGIELGYSATGGPPTATVVRPPHPPKQARLASERGKSYARVLDRLKSKHPYLTEGQLLNYIKMYRGRTRFTGLSIEVIVSGISKIILSEVKLTQPIVRPKTITNRPLGTSASVAPAPPEPPKIKHHGENPWRKPPTAIKQWTDDDASKNCAICLDELNNRNSMKVECGHRFHPPCIKKWLQTSSNCPVCRIHTLLPDEYPALK